MCTNLEMFKNLLTDKSLNLEIKKKLVRRCVNSRSVPCKSHNIHHPHLYYYLYKNRSLQNVPLLKLSNKKVLGLANMDTMTFKIIKFSKNFVILSLEMKYMHCYDFLSMEKQIEEMNKPEKPFSDKKYQNIGLDIGNR